MRHPWWLSSKASTCNAGDTADTGLILRWERSPGGGHGNPLQYSRLENPMDWGTWLAIVHRVTESDTTEVTEHTYTRTLWKHSSESYFSVEVYGADLQLYIVKKLEKKKSQNLVDPWNGKEYHILDAGPRSKLEAVCLKTFSPLTIIK